MAGKLINLVNRVKTGPRSLWRKSVQPLHRNSSVRVGVTRAYLGIGPQIPGMQWGGGISISVERQQLNILKAAISDPAKAKPAITLLKRINAGKISFEHLEIVEFRALKADLVALTTQKHNGALATIAQNVLDLEGPKYDAAIERLATVAQESSVVEAPAIPVTEESSVLSGLHAITQPANNVVLIANGQEALIADMENIGGICTKGGREANQDAVVVHTNPETGVVSIGVFDGMGGHALGEKASMFAALETQQVFIGSQPLDQTLTNSHAKIHQARQTSRTNMGSTGIVAQIDADQVSISSVGDSRAILVKADGSIVIAAPDDNYFIAAYPAFGKVDQAETLNFPHSDQALVAGYWQAAKNSTSSNATLLTTHLGQESTIAETKGQPVELKINKAQLNLEEGDLLILCSDGLTDFLDYEEFKAVVEQNKHKKPEEIAQALHDAALANMAGKTGDNITIVAHKQPAMAEILGEESVLSGVKIIEPEEMGESTIAELAEMGIPVSDIDDSAPPIPVEENDGSVIEAVEASETGTIVNLGTLEEDEEVGVPAEIIFEETVEEPTSGPATQPEQDPRVRAAGEIGSDTALRQVEQIVAPVMEPRPEQGGHEGTLELDEDPTTIASAADMGDPTVAGTQGLGGEEEPTAPTGPLAILMQDIGLKTNRDAILDSLIEIATDPTIVSTEAEVSNLLKQLVVIEIFFVTDEDLIGQVAFNRLILLDQLKALRGDE